MNVAAHANMGAVGNHAYQSVNDAYRFPNAHQPPQRQPEFVKPANPPLKMLVPSDMVGAIIGAFTLCNMIKGKFMICRFDSQNFTVIDVHEKDVGCVSFSS